jgi:thioredoxin 1
MPVHHPSDLDNFKTLLKNHQYVVVDFTATWCGPCKAIAPKFEEFSNKYKKWTFCKVDVDSASDISDEYSVSAMPTFVFIKDGKVIAKFSGANVAMLESKLSTL